MENRLTIAGNADLPHFGIVRQQPLILKRHAISVKASSRSLALIALRQWREGTELADRIVLDEFGRTVLTAPDRAFALELFYGVLRNRTLLDFWIGELRIAPLDE